MNWIHPEQGSLLRMCHLMMCWIILV